MTAMHAQTAVSLVDLYLQALHLTATTCHYVNTQLKCVKKKSSQAQACNSITQEAEVGG